MNIIFKSFKKQTVEISKTVTVSQTFSTWSILEIFFLCFCLINNIFNMRSSLKICNKVSLKNQKDLELYKKREEQYIVGTPKILIGKSGLHYREIWTDDLKHQSLKNFKDLNSNQKAFAFARRVLQVCVSLAPVYGYFILNQNMIFFNQEEEIFTWINPNILQNRVKIYLPPTPKGEMAMMRSIIIFLKPWLRCDFALLNKAEHLNQLLPNLQPMKPKQLQHQKLKVQQNYQAVRKSSFNLHEGRLTKRNLQDQNRLTEQTANPFIKNDLKEKKFKQTFSKGSESTKLPKERFQQQIKSQFKVYSRISNDYEEFKKTETQISYQKKEPNGFEHNTFTNICNQTHSKTFFNNTLSMKSYFPNKTTSRKHHIVKMISEYDDNPDNFRKNNIILGQDSLKEQQKRKKRKVSGNEVIGEELNDLFQSGILEQQSSNEMFDSYIRRQFDCLLE